MKIEKIERENTIIFTSLELREKHKILLFFTSRKGGYSSGEYDSLNLGYHVGDDPENVNKNRDKLFDLLKFSSSTGFISLNQEHSDRIIDIDGRFIESNPDLTGIKPYFSIHNQSKISADGLITGISLAPLIVMAADCNLILITDIKKRVVAAVHAGWRGVLKKIELNAVNLIKENYGSDSNDIFVFIGPSIRKCCFKVTEEILNLFIETFKKNLPVQKVKNSLNSSKYYLIDLVEIIKNNLINSGIPKNNIIDSGLCTYCNKDNLFFSYRKDKKTGRHAGIIMLE